MAITTMDQLVAGVAGGERVYLQKNVSPTVTTLTHTSFWKVAGQPAAAATPPTGAGEAPTKATAGALPWTNPSGGAKAYLAAVTGTAEDLGIVAIYDRLVHTSGLSGTVTTTQAINSAALTRYTDGAGVELWLEVYTTIGGTARTATITYVNQAGATKTTSVQTSTSTMNTGRMLQVPLAAGDTGIRSVTDLTWSASTGAAGDFGIVLLRRLGEMACGAIPALEPRDAFDLGMPEIQSDACLATMTFMAATAPGPFSLGLTIAKG